MLALRTVSNDQPTNHDAIVEIDEVELYQRPSWIDPRIDRGVIWECGMPPT